VAGLIAWWRRWRDSVAGATPVTDERAEAKDAEAEADDGDDDVPDAVAMPIGDELDLHHFQPREVADLVAEYLAEAQAIGLTRVRIIHGKGTGALRRTVHAVLERHPAVASFRLGDERSGSWGATLVDLRSSAPD
jgi:dsDNA-specific endonuclease/ATPase MutS2